MYIRGSARRMPDPAQAAFAAATAHHAAGRLRDAAELYKQVVAADPTNAAAFHRLGTIAHAAGHQADAARLIGHAIALRPDDADAHVNLGVVLNATGRTAAAVDCYRRAIGLRPELPAAHNNLGNALQSLGQLDEAIASYGRAVAADPKYAAAHGNLGNALRAAGRVDEAVASHRRAVSLRPNDANGYHNLAISLTDAGHAPEAAAARRRAAELDPRLADPTAAYESALAEAERLWDEGRPADAAAAYRRAASVSPEVSGVWFNLSVALAAAGDPDAAADAAGRALALRPNSAEVLNHLATAKKGVGRVGEAVALYRRALAAEPGNARTHSNLVYALSFDPDATAADILAEARRWDAVHGRQSTERPFAAAPVGRRLRIGYVSPDFRDHVVGRNVLPLLRHHDRSAIEVFCYAAVAKPDAFTERCRSAADVWRDIAKLDDDAGAAELVAADGIDILVDLTLHMADNRLGLFARRPAPVQVTFAGYPGTTGLSAIDYRLTDPHLDPPGTDGDYAERSVRLPHSFWCYDPESMGVADAPAPGELPAVANGFVTFGCLNNFAKTNDAVLAAWRRVLDGVPASRLVLLAPPGSARDRARVAFGDRVDFVPFQSRADYLSAYRAIDVGLDTFPYNGHTTSLDGLWMGVPTVTLAGRTVVGRAGWSQLSNLGLTELAAADVDGFVDTAVRLATDRPRLTALRAGLRDRLRRSPLCDAAGFTRGVEAAFRAMVGPARLQRASDGPA
jgi:protein O-GlcNAc transferase